MWLLSVTTLVSAHFALVEILTQDRQGSGVRVSVSHVITNEHVVAEASVVWVVCSEARTKARVVSSDVGLDLALLELEEPDRCRALSAVFRPLGALAGERLTARGCPHGRCHKVSRGEVLARIQVGGQDRLVTTLPVRPGSSGGPASDEEGYVVGIVFAYSREASNPSVTYGLLIPADRVLEFLLRSCRHAGGTPLSLQVGEQVGEHACPRPLLPPLDLAFDSAR